MDALDAHARPSLGFVGTEEGRGKMMIWSGGFRNILMDKEGVRAEDTYLWADLRVQVRRATRRREVLRVVTFLAGAAGCLVGEYESLIDVGHEN